MAVWLAAARQVLGLLAAKKPHGWMAQAAAIVILVRADTNICGRNPGLAVDGLPPQLARASRISSQYAAIRSLP